MKIFVIFSILIISCTIDPKNCTNQTKIPYSNINNRQCIQIDLIQKTGNTIQTRFEIPDGYKRITVDSNSFAEYLRNLALKTDGSKVMLYNGTQKFNQGAQIAVVDLKIGNKDLHQCADAVMRLRAEYLYNQKLYDKIHFNFTNGFRVDYSKWMKGYRIIVKGNKTYWSKSAGYNNSYESFWKYMETIFMFAGTLSLSKELKTVNDIHDIQIGDVFIQGGSPGHAVIVVDVAKNQETEDLIFLLAQSYMPAQEIHVLKNPKNSKLSPWYSLYSGEQLITPEWHFKKTDLMRFGE